MVAAQHPADKQETETNHRVVKKLYERIYKCLGSISALNWHRKGEYDGGDPGACQHVRVIRRIYRDAIEWIMHGAMKCSVQGQLMPVEHLIEETRSLTGLGKFREGRLRETNGVRAVLDHAGHLTGLLFDSDLEDKVREFENLSESNRQEVSTSLHRCLTELFTRHPVDVKAAEDALRLEERAVHAYLDGRVPVPLRETPREPDAEMEDVLLLDPGSNLASWKGKEIKLRSSQRSRLFVELGRLRDEEGSAFIKGFKLSQRAQFADTDQILRGLEEAIPELRALIENDREGYRLALGVTVTVTSL